MSDFQLVGVALMFVALLAYFNTRFVRLPASIGMTVISLIVSFGFIVGSHFMPAIADRARTLIGRIDFPDIVFHGLLGILLFASALQVRFKDIKDHRWAIVSLATVGVILSTFIVGGLGWLVGELLGVQMDAIWYFVFGALISPTDPIAVLALLKQVGAPKEIETKIAGEALFNDGTAVAIFIVLLSIAKAGDLSVAKVLTNGSWLMIKEGLGGILVGLTIGAGAAYLIKTIDSYEVETTITLALATGGYALAEAIHTSAPIAVVVMGLLVGNLGTDKIMSDETQEKLFNFWEVLDEILNLVLFTIIGLYIITIDHTLELLMVSATAVPVVLVARLLSVAIPLNTIRAFAAVYPHSIKILTWGGLRGAISIALVLSLPEFTGKDYVIGATYTVVLFSLLVQGLTMKSFLTRTLGLHQGNN